MNLKHALTILLVDDNPIDREIFCRNLLLSPTFQYNILEATSGKEGLRQCYHLQPNAIFLNFQLPDMNGLEFLKKLSKQTQNLFPPVFMLFDRTNASFAVQAIEAGAKGYIDKGQGISEELYLMLEITILLNLPSTSGCNFLIA